MESAAFRFIALPLAVGAAFVLVGILISCAAGFAVL